MKNSELEIVPCLLSHFEALLQSNKEFCEKFNYKVANNVTAFPEALKQGYQILKENPKIQKWWTYLVIYKAEKILIGFCGFKGLPKEGIVEIGYEIAPKYRGQGFATEAALWLCKRAQNVPGVKGIIAHTLPQSNASTKVLEKCGFYLQGEVLDPQDGKVFLWNKCIIRKGEILEIQVQKIIAGGLAVANYQGIDIFIKNALPQDILRVKAFRKRRKYFGSIEEIITPSPWRISPKCVYSGTCGGCKWQEFDYKQQLKAKHEMVKDSFSILTTNARIDFPVAAENNFYYRNKMEFSFGTYRWLFPEEIGQELDKPRDFALGLHIPGRYDRILDIDICHLQSETSWQIVNMVRSLVLQEQLCNYNVKTHEGFMRFLMIREGKNTGDLMVNIVTAQDAPDKLRTITIKLVENFPQITSILNNVNTSKSQVSYGEKEYVLYGKATICEILGNFTFEISANSFFQNNTAQTYKLYNAIVDFAQFSGQEIVYDLYCGAGTISIFISKLVKKVVGFEFVKEAIANARHNAQINKIENCDFIECDLKNITKELPQAPDIVIVDPPRAGVHPNVIKALVNWNASKIIYVSCNPTSQAQDIEKLLEQGYKLRRVLPVDMFPHTYHIETVSLLEK